MTAELITKCLIHPKLKCYAKAEVKEGRLAFNYVSNALNLIAINTFTYRMKTSVD